MAADPILITGGAGFLGINLCRHLLARGTALRSLDIAPFDYPEARQLDAQLGDIRDRDALDRALHGVQTVVHCAAALPRAGARQILSTNVGGTRLLLERCLAQQVRRFVFISSTAVYGVPDHEPIVEQDALRGVGPYGISKVQAEAACESARQQGLCLSILRPKTFVGPERLGVFELLYSWAYEGRNFPVLGRGDNLYQLLDVRDLCEVIDRLLGCEPAVANETYNVAASQFETMRQNIQAVLDRAGRGAHVVSLPRTPAIAVLRALEGLHLSPLYAWVYATAARNSWVSIARLQSRLGFTPRYSNKDALISNYDWYVAHRAAARDQKGVSHRVAWRHGLLEWAKYAF